MTQPEPDKLRCLWCNYTTPRWHITKYGERVSGLAKIWDHEETIHREDILALRDWTQLQCPKLP